MRVPQRFNVLVVPSGGIEPINNLEGTTTLLRCEKALKLWQTERYDFILVTGGQCHPPTIETQPAAETMQTWFMTKGIPKRSIFMELQARDTFENVQYSFLELQDKRIASYQLTIVSHPLHSVRFWISALILEKRLVTLKPVWARENWPVAIGLILFHLIWDPKGVGKIAQTNRAKRGYPKFPKIGG